MDYKVYGEINDFLDFLHVKCNLEKVHVKMKNFLGFSLYNKLSHIQAL